MIGFYTLIGLGLFKDLCLNGQSTPKILFLKLQGREDAIKTWGWMGVDGMDHNSKYLH